MSKIIMSDKNESTLSLRQTNILLIVVLLIAAFLRLILLSEIPKGFNCDEAVSGYEAYSILETLRDRYGEFLPLFVRVMGDYRASLYAFFTIPFIKVFGLNEFATRLPAAIFGILTVWFVFELAKELFDSRTALIAALLLAINPWSIHFSRTGYEVSLLACLFCLALLLFLKSLARPNLLILSALVFGLSLNTYQPARVFVPLFLAGLTYSFRNHILRYKQQAILASFLFLAIFSLLFMFWISPEGMARANQVGIKTNLLQLVQNYISFFDPRYLFFRGTLNASLNPAAIGCLHFFELVTVILGIIYLILKRTKETNLLILWLFLYPIPAALVDFASPIRSILGSPLFAILSSYGFVKLLDFFKSFRKPLFKSLTIFLIVLVFANFSYFISQYFINYSLEASIAWKYGMREAINYAESHSYQCVVMSSDRNSQCFAIHDFIAQVPFYAQYPPIDYQRSPISPWVGGSRDRIYSLGKYNLVSIEKQEQLNDGCLYIIRPDEIPALVGKGYNWKEVYAIKDPRGFEHFKLVNIHR